MPGGGAIQEGKGAGRDPRRGLEKTRVLVDVKGREKEAEGTLRTHMWEAGNGGAGSG